MKRIGVVIALLMFACLASAMSGTGGSHFSPHTSVHETMVHESAPAHESASAHSVESIAARTRVMPQTYFASHNNEHELCENGVEKVDPQGTDQVAVICKEGGSETLDDAGKKRSMVIIACLLTFVFVAVMLA